MYEMHAVLYECTLLFNVQTDCVLQNLSVHG